jgi:hypothetical protein
MTTAIKIYSKTKPVRIPGPLEFLHISYNSSVLWFSQFNTDDYDTTRSELEKEGYTAHPASYKEIENNIYTIFKETV